MHNGKRYTGWWKNNFMEGEGAMEFGFEGEPGDPWPKKFEKGGLHSAFVGVGEL